MKKPPLLLTLGAAIVLIGGGVAAYWAFTKRDATNKVIPVGASLVPEDALMTISFSTNENQWRLLRSFGTPQTQAALDQNLAQWRDQILTANGLVYQKDIQPWVGEEITLAFLPPSEAIATPPGDTPAEPSDDNSPESEPDSSNSSGSEAAPSPEDQPSLAETEPLDSEQPLLMVLPIANAAKAQQILANSKAFDADWTEREYKGISIRETAPDASKRYSTAVVGNEFIVVTTDANTTEALIDTYKGEDAVTDTPGLRAAFAAVQEPDAFAKLYINVPAATQLAAANSARSVPPQGLSAIQNNQGLAATITLESNGLRLQGVTWLQADSDRRYEVTNSARQMPRQLPANTLMMVSGGNLKQLWQDYAENAPPQAMSPIHPDSLRAGLQATTGLDVDADILSWMGGEFALALVPVTARSAGQSTSPNSGSPSPQPQSSVAAVFMVQASDRKRADQTLTQLSETLASQYRFQVEEASLGGQPIVNWISPFGALTVSQGWLENNIAFFAFGKAAANQIVPTPSSPLADSRLFEAVTAGSPEPNNGHFFVALDPLLNAQQNLPLPALPPQSQSIAQAIQAIGVTAAIQDARTIRYDIQVELQKGDRPGALPSPKPAGQPEPSPSPSTTPKPE